jgi:porphobilinogen synthase
MQLPDNGFALLYMANVGHAWPQVQGRGKITQFLGRTGGIDFHAAIVQITGPTAEAELGCLGLGEIAESDALHASTHKPAFCRALLHKLTYRVNMAFPIQRLRRLRSSEAIRRLVRETQLAPSQFILPLFVVPGQGIRKEILSMPGNAQMSVDNIVRECHECRKIGLGGVILFGIPEHKDEIASGAYDPDGITQQAIRAIKKEVPGLLVMTDVCNCEYTSHGHCGRIKDGDVENDTTLGWLAKTAVSHANAGADVVAPSDMMDGRVEAIRKALDAAGHIHTPILSYAAKYASAFYGPFREAAESTPQFGDRRSYQMDCANGREAMREIELDLEEGADMIMVKPAMAYLDIIRQARDRFDVPLGAYQVSGEFSMIMAAAKNGWLDLDRTILESLTSIRRAGADFVLTYFAKRATELIA